MHEIITHFLLDNVLHLSGVVTISSMFRGIFSECSGFPPQKYTTRSPVLLFSAVYPLKIKFIHSFKVHKKLID